MTLQIEDLSVTRLGPRAGCQPEWPLPVVESRLSASQASGQGSYRQHCLDGRQASLDARPAAYHASKWGLLGFSHALHAEARRDNIKVTAVVAGGMRTPFIWKVPRY